MGFEDVMGEYRIGERNERGEQLLEFARNNRLYIANTKMQGRKKCTWEPPASKSLNIYDMILLEEEWENCVTNCRAFFKRR